MSLSSTSVRPSRSWSRGRSCGRSVVGLPSGDPAFEDALEFFRFGPIRAAIPAKHVTTFEVSRLGIEGNDVVVAHVARALPRHEIAITSFNLRIRAFSFGA